jgi:hypothetical protein
MIRNKKYLLALSLIVALINTSLAQSTINSPYSKYGLGNLNGSYLPQNRSMGNLAYGVSGYGGYNNVNVSNPASYSQIKLTVFDVGLGLGAQTLQQGSNKSNSFNATLSHLVFAVPVSKKSALSIGILPYSNLGYLFSDTTKKVGELSSEQIYAGEGGLTKAYLGYGIGFGKNFNIGFNMSYLFGNLRETRSVEFSKYMGMINSRTEDNNSVGGLNFDLGAQYNAMLGKTQLTLGYTGGLQSTLNNKNSSLTTRYSKNFSSEEEYRVDTISIKPDTDKDLILPSNHNFGISFSKYNKWLIGADFRMSNWSDFKIDGISQNLNNAWGVSVGGKITPNINAVTNYFKLVDYSLGVNYDKTSLAIDQTDIDVKSIHFGLGLPLISNRGSFYKINFTTEIGQRGKNGLGLVKENFYNFYLGFTINDRWFQKYKFD